jgi:hypothetical protein
VLGLMAEGMTTRAIAAEVGVSETAQEITAVVFLKLRDCPGPGEHAT